MTAFEVPGISLAIVKDGKTIVAKGYGVRKLGEAAPVDAKTQFGIASNTKVATAVALGMLVEEGKIEWDAPVVRYLPWFQMSDPYVTREMTIRDLLVHRSGLGLGAGDLLWWPPSTYDRREIARRLRNIPLATSFRSAYAYDNVLYLVAGEVIETISGQSWEDFMASRVLKKAGMTGSNGAPFRRHPRRQFRHAARQRRWARPADQSFRQRQHEPGRWHQLQRRGHGEVDERTAWHVDSCLMARVCSATRRSRRSPPS